MAAKPLTKLIQSEVERLVRHSSAQQIVRGQGYLYFSIQPTQEDIKIEPLCRKGDVVCFKVLNYRAQIIGYLVVVRNSPRVVAQEFGAAIYYARRKAYEKVKVEFWDQKFRLLSFDTRDYFVSVKWKSNNQGEAV